MPAQPPASCWQWSWVVNMVQLTLYKQINDEQEGISLKTACNMACLLDTTNDQYIAICHANHRWVPLGPGELVDNTIILKGWIINTNTLKANL